MQRPSGPSLPAWPPLDASGYGAARFDCDGFRPWEVAIPPRDVVSFVSPLGPR